MIARFASLLALAIVLSFVAAIATPADDAIPEIDAAPRKLTPREIVTLYQDYLSSYYTLCDIGRPPGWTAKLALATQGGRTEGMEAVLKALAEDDAETREFALLVLCDLEEIPAAAQDAVIKLLDDENGTNRNIARHLLQKIRPAPANAVAALRDRLAFADEWERERILSTMYRVATDDREVSRQLIETIADETRSIEERYTAAYRLGDMQCDDEAAVAALVEATRDEKLLYEAVQSLIKRAPEHDRLREIVSDYVEGKNTNLWRSDDLLLAGPRGKHLADIIAPLLDEEDHEKRVFAARVLLAFDPECDLARRAIVEDLQHPAAKVRASASRSVSLYPFAITDDAVTVSMLDSLTGDSDNPGDYNSSYMRVLGLMGPRAKAAVPRLRVFVAQGSQAAAKALVAIDEERVAHSDMVTYLADPSNYDYEMTVLEIAEAYGAMDVAAETITSMLVKHGACGRAFQGITALGPRAAPAVPQLIELLDHPEFEERQHAAALLGVIGPAAKKAIPKLELLKRDEHLFVRWQAEDALARIRAE